MTHNSSRAVYQLTAALILLLVFFSCKKADVRSANTDSDEQLISAAKPMGSSKPGTVPPVNLSLTVSDASGNKILSDGNGAYVNGQQNVSAYFDQYGNLQFDSNTAMSRKSGDALRTMSFLFDQPCVSCGTTSTGAALTNSKGNYRMVTQIYGQTPMQSLNVGDVESGIGLGGGFTSQVSSSTDWNFNLRYGIEQNNGTLSFVTVTHPDDSSWIMTGEVATPVAALKTNGTLTGYYYLPFSFTFTRK